MRHKPHFMGEGRVVTCWGNDQEAKKLFVSLNVYLLINLMLTDLILMERLKKLKI